MLLSSIKDCYSEKKTIVDYFVKKADRKFPKIEGYFISNHIFMDKMIIK